MGCCLGGSVDGTSRKPHSELRQECKSTTATARNAYQDESNRPRGKASSLRDSSAERAGATVALLLDSRFTPCNFSCLVCRSTTAMGFRAIGREYGLQAPFRQDAMQFQASTGAARARPADGDVAANCHTVLSNQACATHPD